MPVKKSKHKGPKTFADFYNIMVMQKIAHDTAPSTMARIEVIWRKSLSPFWKDITPDKINQQLITEFIGWHKEHRQGVQLINVFKYLGNIMQVMIESGDLEAGRKPKLELPKNEQKHHAKQKGRYIKDDEFHKILVKTVGWFRLYFLIIYTSGMRKMELGKLSISRLRRVDNRFIAILTTDDTKTGRPREVPFSELLTPLIEDQLKLDSPYLFPSENRKKHITAQAIDQRWMKAKLDAGIDGKMRLHDCRHSCASNLAKDNINPLIVVTNLGMSLAMYQKTYLKLTAQDLFIASDSSNKRIGKL